MDTNLKEKDEDTSMLHYAHHKVCVQREVCLCKYSSAADEAVELVCVCVRVHARASVYVC